MLGALLGLVGLVVVVLAVMVAVGVIIYNGLVGLRNRVRNAWSQIDVQLKRRHDLVPNLVNAVKGIMAHERAVLDRVTQARASAIAAGNDVAARSQAENELTGAMRSLFAVAEAYPALRSNENMLMLQEELSSTENRIAFARQHYNDSAMAYNTARQQFPAVLFAASLGFRTADPFALDDAAERAVPTVSF
ncbi:MAG TPA: LemA family protein [Chloroflexota bacterium]|nr:LemA family protein [Chloroflexota bacterium]